MDIINLKISKVGGLTHARQIRDLCVTLGIPMTIEDTWGGDITTAAIAHLAHSTPERLRFSSTDFNSYITASVACRRIHVVAKQRHDRFKLSAGLACNTNYSSGQTVVGTLLAASPRLRLSNSATSIIHIASPELARKRSSCAAAKAALVSFTRSWALELATTGIAVNAVSPGPTETELFRANTPFGSEGEALCFFRGADGGLRYA